ncbi:MAG: hypothetical protein AAF752_16535, partial [Bacteroidota bacterium]
MKTILNSCAAHAESGQTTLELLVILLVAGFVAVGAFQLYEAAHRTLVDWQRAEAFRTEAHVLLDRVSRDVADAERIVPAESTWTLTRPNRGAIRYRFTKGRLYRGATSVNSSQTRLDHFAIRPTPDGHRITLSA